MPASLSLEDLDVAASRLTRANEAFAARYPGEDGARQPVHTVYGGAQLFRSDSTGRLGQVGRRALHGHAPPPAPAPSPPGAPPRGRALGGVRGRRASPPARRVGETLAGVPLEDFRLD